MANRCVHIKSDLRKSHFSFVITKKKRYNVFNKNDIFSICSLFICFYSRCFYIISTIPICVFYSRRLIFHLCLASPFLKSYIEKSPKISHRELGQLCLICIFNSYDHFLHHGAGETNVYFSSS